MDRYTKPLLAASTMVVLGYLLWPLLSSYLPVLKAELIEFKAYCRAHPYYGYLLYASIFSMILLLGLPMGTAVMLLAGILYSFWEAATLVTACRLSVAVLAFGAARHFIETPRRRKRIPPFLCKFEEHPSVSLFFMRLVPLPDSVVNVAMGATPIRGSQYVVISLLGMIPLTMICVWLGNELGSVTGLLQLILG